VLGFSISGAEALDSTTRVFLSYTMYILKSLDTVLFVEIWQED